MRTLWCTLLLVGTAAPVAAQTPQPAPRATLSLEEALDIAKQNNPVYLQSVTGRSRAAAGVRSAYGSLIPSVSADMGASYREGRPQFFGGVAFGATSDVLSSNWSLNARSSYNLGTLAEIKRANAAMDAADADVENSLYALRNGVTGQFLLALQLQARASLQDTLVAQQRLQLQLAQARAGVGSGTPLDVKRAEVGLGQQEVAALRAHNGAEVARLQLFQQLGVAMPGDVTLNATLPLELPTFVLEDLLGSARQSNPALRASQARARVADANVRAARGQYAPTLSLQASIGGAAQKQTNVDGLIAQQQSSTLRSRESCFTTDSIRTGAGMSSIAAQCGAIAWTPAAEQALRDANSDYPFGFTRQPYNFSVGISLPLFDGLGREQRMQEATAGRSDAQYGVRRQELALTADVTSALVTLRAGRQTVDLQNRNAATAREALQLAEERYRVGASTFVDLTTARAEYERAETDRIDAVYEFHRAFAALEAAVGRTLR